MRLSEELLTAYAPLLTALELRPAAGGRFEISLDGSLVFSKLQLHRFPQTAEVVKLFSPSLGRPLIWRPLRG